MLKKKKEDKQEPGKVFVPMDKEVNEINEEDKELNDESQAKKNRTKDILKYLKNRSI